MATETNGTSSETSSGDERDEDATVDEGREEDQAQEEDEAQKDDNELSQEERAARSERAMQEQYAESRRKVGPIIMAASAILGAIGLITVYLGSTLTAAHSTTKTGLSVLGVVVLVLAGVIYIRKNWPRTLVLVAMPFTIIAILLSLPVTPTPKYLVLVLCAVELYVMFRQPVLDEFDAPKE